MVRFSIDNFIKWIAVGFLCTYSLGITQTPDFLWLAQAGGTNQDEGNSVSIDGYGNIILTGIFYDTLGVGNTQFVTNGGQDIFIAKYDRDGEFLWAVQAGGEKTDRSNDVATDDAGNVFVVGYTSGTPTFGDSTLNLPTKNTAFLVKYNREGQFQWVRTFPGTNSNTEVKSVALDPDGNIFLAIDFNTDISFGTVTFSGHGDGLLVKLDPSGEFLWGQQFDSPYPNIVYMAGVAVDQSGNSVVAGNFVHDSVFVGDTALVSTGGYDIFLVKYRPNGSMAWIQQGKGSSRNYVYDVATDEDGNVFLCGDYTTEAIFETIRITPGGAFIVKYDDQGNVKWVQSPGTTSNAALSVAAGADGSATIVGWYRTRLDIGDTTLTTAQYDLNAFMANYNRYGNFSWALQGGGVNGSSNQDKAFGVAMDKVGAAVVTGYFNGTAQFNDFSVTTRGGHDVFLTKILEGDGAFPEVFVSPLEFHITLQQGRDTTITLNIQNRGEADLNWALTEERPGSILGDSLDQVIGVSAFSVGGIAYDPDLDAVWVCDPLTKVLYLHEKQPPYNRILTMDMPADVPGGPMDVVVKDSLLIITDTNNNNFNAPYDDFIFSMNKSNGNLVQMWHVDGPYNPNPYDAINRVSGITMNDRGEFFVTDDTTHTIRKIELNDDGTWRTLDRYLSPYFGPTGTISWDSVNQGFWISHLDDPEAPYFFTDSSFQPVASFPKPNKYCQTVGVVPNQTLWLGNTPYINIVRGRIFTCDWIRPNVAKGFIPPTGIIYLPIFIHTADLEPGRYLCYLLVHSNDPYQRVVQVAVWLTVESPVGIQENAGRPRAFALYPNYPNPFNPTTTIAYDLPEAAYVTLEIFDLMGRRIRLLVNQQQAAGTHRIRWNSENDAGERVSSGVYLVRIRVYDAAVKETQPPDFIKIHKIVLLK